MKWVMCLLLNAVSIYPGTSSLPTRDGNAGTLWSNRLSLEKARLRNQEGEAQGMGEGVGLELKPHDSQSSTPLILSFSFQR